MANLHRERNCQTNIGVWRQRRQRLNQLKRSITMRAVPAGPAYLRSNPNQWVLLLALLGVALGMLFSQSFKPHEILFNNDTPLGTLKAEQARLPDRFAGSWYNTTWLGGAGATAA